MVHSELVLDNAPVDWMDACKIADFSPAHGRREGGEEEENHGLTSEDENTLPSRGLSVLRLPPPPLPNAQLAPH